MYRLLVFRGSATPVECVALTRAAEVLEQIPQLLDRHAGCERVEVMLKGTLLFSVDCRGNLLPR